MSHVVSSILSARQELHSFYNYDPNKALAVIAAILYGLTTCVHIYQTVRYRSWFFSAIVVGGLMETFGYLGRIFSAGNVYNRGLYIGQFSLIVLAPVFVAASDYVLFGRLLTNVLSKTSSTQNEARSLGIPARWMTMIFVGADILSFVLQGGGGGIVSAASGGINLNQLKLGENIMLVGLGVQIVCFGFFTVATVRFDFKSRSLVGPTVGTPRWRILLWCLYASCALILVRSCFRVAEFSQGFDGYLASHEVYFYCLDALPMLPCFIIFNIFHPAHHLGEAPTDSDDMEKQISI
ncbi:hypothetical protein RUND412_008892 [Rhizina undulata]